MNKIQELTEKAKYLESQLREVNREIASIKKNNDAIARQKSEKLINLLVNGVRGEFFLWLRDNITEEDNSIINSYMCVDRYYQAHGLALLSPNTIINYMKEFIRHTNTKISILQLCSTQVTDVINQYKELVKIEKSE